MKPILAIFKKDLKTYLGSFSAFFLLGIFALVSGLFFIANLLDFHSISLELSRHPRESVSMPVTFNQAVVVPFFMNVSLVLLLIVPVVTMRSFSEERKLGTFELLFTYPVTDFQIVLGKFCALVAYLSLFFVPSVANFCFLYWTKFHFQIFVLLSAYLGLFLVALALTSIGMLFSSLTENQTVSAIFSFLIFVLWWFSGLVGEWFFAKSFFFVKEMWLVEHLRDFTRGIVDTRHVTFYLIVTAFFFFTTLLSIETRSWKR